MKKAIIPAFLLVLGSTVLGATVLQERLAWAAPPLPSVFVTNDAANPVPAREQNVDADGNIKVHEQGTADVNVTNTSLPVEPPEPVAGGSGSVILFCPSDEVVFQFPRAATAIQVAWSEPAFGPVSLRLGQLEVVQLLGPDDTGDRHLVLPLTRAVAFNRIVCFQNSTGAVRVSWIGNEP
jgi:hypothetical protein